MGITSTGIGSGLEVETIISKLVALEKQPLKTLQTKAAVLEARISDYSQIKSLVSTLSDAASKLALDSGWNSLNVNSSNSAVSATITGFASATSFSMGVQQLARAQSTVSSAVTAGAPTGMSGTLSLQLGTWTGSTFAAVSATSVPVNVLATDTMAQIAGKINSAGAGVVATVLSDSSGDRLMVRSTSTGEVSGFRITAADADGNDTDAAGLSSLAFDLGATTAYGMGANTYQTAQNAKATINGIAMTSATNSFKDVVAGLTITASAVTSTNAEVTLTSDKTAVTKNITDFVAAYNAVNDYLAKATAYDATSKKSGDLQGDSTAIGLRNTLRAMLGTGTTGGSFTHLFQIGISMGRDGNLTTDATKLGTALNQPDVVKTLFAQKNSDGQTSGIAQKIKAYTGGLLAFTGQMNNKADALEAEVKRNGTEQDKVNARAEVVEKRLRATYTALDVKMASLNALNTYITNQVAAWNSEKSS